METHYFGTLEVTRAFAPRSRRDGGAPCSTSSRCSPGSPSRVGAYCAAKSAEWALTNALRQELAPQGTPVTALHVGYMDTDMAAGVDGPKSDPADVARLGVEAIVAGEFEVIADDVTRQVLGGLSAGVGALYPDLAPPAA